MTALEAAGICAAELRSEVGFPDPTVLDPHTQLDAKWYFHALEVAVRLAQTPKVLLELGQRFSPDEMGLLGYTAQTMETLRDVCDYACEYLKHWNGALAYGFQSTRSEARLRFTPHDDGRVGAAYATVVAAVRTANLLRAITTQPPRLLRVMLPIEPDGLERCFSEFFACPIAFTTREALLCVDSSSLKTPLRLSHSGIAARLREDLDVAIGGSRRYRWDDAVRGAIRAVIPKQPVTVSVIAHRLGISSRTLQRRLAASSTSLRAEKERVLRDLALSYLSDDTIPFAEVGYCLGFASSSALCRACQRWFSASPSEMRDRLARQDTPA